MAEAPVDDRYTLNDNIRVVLHDRQLLSLLSANDPLHGGWRGLASRLNYSYDDVCKFERKTDPCQAVLEVWKEKQGSTIRAFLHALQHRDDVKARLQTLMKGEALFCLRLIIMIINIKMLLCFIQNYYFTDIYLISSIYRILCKYCADFVVANQLRRST